MASWTLFRVPCSRQALATFPAGSGETLLLLNKSHRPNMQRHTASSQDGHVDASSQLPLQLHRWARLFSKVPAQRFGMHDATSFRTPPRIRAGNVHAMLKPTTFSKHASSPLAKQADTPTVWQGTACSPKTLPTWESPKE